MRIYYLSVMKLLLSFFLITILFSCESSDEETVTMEDLIIINTVNDSSANKAPYQWNSGSAQSISDSALNYGTYTVTVSDSI